MPNYKLFVPFILHWEAGIADDKADSGGLTNKGITFGTYRVLSRKVLGKKPTRSNFLSLSKKDAELFIKHFWSKATGKNTIRSQKIAEAVTSWFWGSGLVGLKNFQRLLNKKFGAKIKVDGVVGRITTTAVNSVNSDRLFIEMIRARKSFFIGLAKRRPKDKRFINGWLNRLNDFYLRHKTETDPTLKIIGTALVVIGSIAALNILSNS